jgi:preprotein translocase subunit SecE
VADKIEKEKKPNVIQRYFRETVGELRKVNWPTPREAWHLTRIVLLVLAVMSIALGSLDFIFSKIIELIVV